MDSGFHDFWREKTKGYSRADAALGKRMIGSNVAVQGLNEAREKLQTAKTELLARHEDIAHLAHSDPLKQLPNRVALAQHFALKFDQATSSRKNFAGLSIDLDYSRKPMMFSVTDLAMICSVQLTGSSKRSRQKRSSPVPGKDRHSTHLALLCFRNGPGIA